MADLHNFVNDELHSLLGFSDNTLVQYICAIAAKAKSVDKLKQDLIAYDMQDGDALTSFAMKVFSRVPRAAAPPKASSMERKKEATNADLIRASQNYALIEDPEIARLNIYNTYI